jgi:hypothetical protein
MEYGLQFYRFNKAQDVVAKGTRICPAVTLECCSCPMKGLAELGEIPGVEIRIVKPMGIRRILVSLAQ